MVYLTLTNNTAAMRPVDATDAANPRHHNDPRVNGTAQRGNPNGHIIRWLEAGNDSALTADNDFSSPDGIWFSEATGICWIQTDDGAYTDVGVIGS